ncbi:MAG: type II toxin-antitoxin system ParD family antitoxin [Pseudomonadota bacterium]
MATTSMTISPEMDEFIKKQIESGNFATASEVVRAALRSMIERQTKLDALRAHVDEGIAQAQRGEFVSATDPEEIVRRAIDRRKSQG